MRSCGGEVKRTAEIFLVAAILCASNLFLIDRALYFFDPFDMSAFMDAGYRVAIGQRPYIDFFYNAGPVHLYLHALFFTIFGFNKYAIFAHLIVVNTVAILAVHFIGRRLDPLLRSGVALLTAISFYGPVAHPWYDQTASLWIILALATLEKNPRRIFLPGLLCGLSIMSKLNVGATGAALLICFMTPLRLRSIAVFSLGIAASVIVLTLGFLEEFVRQTILEYAVQRSDRFLDWLKIWWIILDTPFPYLAMIAACLTPLTRRALLPLVFALVATVNAISGSMEPRANLPLLGVVVLSLAVALHGIRWGRALVLAILILEAGTALCYSYRPIMWVWRPSNFLGGYSITNPAMSGWRAHYDVGRDLDAALEKINTLPDTGQLFIFPDFTILYGLSGRESFKPAPFIFHLREMPAPGRLLKTFRSRFLEDPPKWILLHERKEVFFADAGEILGWLDLKSTVDENYIEIWKHGEVRLLERLDAIKSKSSEKGPFVREQLPRTPGPERKRRAWRVAGGERVRMERFSQVEERRLSQLEKRRQRRRRWFQAAPAAQPSSPKEGKLQQCGRAPA